MRMLASILILLIASDVGGAECGNCDGRRVAGEPPILLPCPVCEGTGTVPDPAPPVFAAAPVVADAVTPATFASVNGKPRPVVARIVSAEGPSRCYGSGTLVEVSGTVGTVLTNWHVVRTHRDGISVRWPDGSTGKATVTAYDEVWDLAALSVPAPGPAPVVIAASSPKRGERLTIAGYGGEGKYLEQTGPVTDYVSPTGKHPRQFVEMKATARQGDSGGPMFTSSGELGGVLFGQARGTTVGACSTRVSVFLREAKAGTTRDKTAQCCDGRCPK
jgi:S1-C subfamily serine protease